MFEQLFRNAALIADYKAAPYAEDHEHFLEHLAEQGYARWTLRLKARTLLHIAQKSMDRKDWLPNVLTLLPARPPEWDPVNF